MSHCLRCGGPATELFLSVQCERIGGCRTLDERIGPAPPCGIEGAALIVETCYRLVSQMANYEDTAPTAALLAAIQRSEPKWQCGRHRHPTYEGAIEAWRAEAIAIDMAGINLPITIQRADWTVAESEEAQRAADIERMERQSERQGVRDYRCACCGVEKGVTESFCHDGPDGKPCGVPATASVPLSALAERDRTKAIALAGEDARIAAVDLVRPPQGFFETQEALVDALRTTLAASPPRWWSKPSGAG